MDASESAQQITLKFSHDPQEASKAFSYAERPLLDCALRRTAN